MKTPLLESVLNNVADLEACNFIKKKLVFLRVLRDFKGRTSANSYF